MLQDFDDYDYAGCFDEPEGGIKCAQCGGWHLYIADEGPYVCADCKYVEGDPINLYKAVQDKETK